MIDVPANARHRFIVIESDPLISLDLIGLLQDGFPESEIISLETFSDDVVGFDSSLWQYTRLLINHRLLTGAVIDHVRAFVAQGARVVVIGSGGGYGFEVAVVDKPFKSKTITAALA